MAHPVCIKMIKVFLSRILIWSRGISHFYTTTLPPLSNDEVGKKSFFSTFKAGSTLSRLSLYFCIVELFLRSPIEQFCTGARDTLPNCYGCPTPDNGHSSTEGKKGSRNFQVPFQRASSKSVIWNWIRCEPERERGTWCSRPPHKCPGLNQYPCELQPLWAK